MGNKSNKTKTQLSYNEYSTIIKSCYYNNNYKIKVNHYKQLFDNSNNNNNNNESIKSIFLSKWIEEIYKTNDEITTHDNDYTLTDDIIKESSLKLDCMVALYRVLSNENMCTRFNIDY